MSSPSPTLSTPPPLFNLQSLLRSGDQKRSPHFGLHFPDQNFFEKHLLAKEKALQKAREVSLIHVEKECSLEEAKLMLEDEIARNAQSAATDLSEARAERDRLVAVLATQDDLTLANWKLVEEHQVIAGKLKATELELARVTVEKEKLETITKSLEHIIEEKTQKWQPQLENSSTTESKTLVCVVDKLEETGVSVEKEKSINPQEAEESTPQNGTKEVETISPQLEDNVKLEKKASCLQRHNSELQYRCLSIEAAGNLAVSELEEKLRSLEREREEERGRLAAAVEREEVAKTKENDITLKWVCR